MESPPRFNTSEKDITFVCELLQKQGYLNDLTYATSYLHDKINMSLDGPLKISNSLKNIFILVNMMYGLSVEENQPYQIIFRK